MTSRWNPAQVGQEMTELRSRPKGRGEERVRTLDLGMVFVYTIASPINNFLPLGVNSKNYPLSLDNILQGIATYSTFNAYHLPLWSSLYLYLEFTFVSAPCSRTTVTAS